MKKIPQLSAANKRNSKAKAIEIHHNSKLEDFHYRWINRLAN